MLETVKNTFIVGIKGAAMSNLAVILKQMGKSVTGCDSDEEFITDVVLKKYDIPALVGFGDQHLSENIDLVVYSAAHGGVNNPIVKAAQKRNILTVSQASLLGELTQHFKTTIAVSGCHGKTTTTSLLAFALKNLGVHPSYLIGAPSFNEMPGGLYDDKEYFAIEADEYGVNPPDDKTPKLLLLHPTHIICTNIDFDHPDVYKDIEETKKIFLTFFGKRKLLLCADDANIQSILSKLDINQYETFGFSPYSDMHILHPDVTETHSTFNLRYKNKDLGEFTFSLFGEKNISNAAGVILALLNLGFESEAIKKAIKGFSSVKRRFEKVYEYKDTYLFDDYGHHPQEIESTILAARKRFPKHRIIVIFQPHTFSRTQSLLKEFAYTLSQADHAFVLPIFPSAREDKSKFSVTSNDIVRMNTKGNIELVDGSVQSFNRLNTQIKKGDIIFTMGAGDIYKMKDDIIRIIQDKI